MSFIEPLTNHDKDIFTVPRPFRSSLMKEAYYRKHLSQESLAMSDAIQEEIQRMYKE